MKEKRELIYIGSSGKIKDGAMIIRKAGIGGLKDRLVNGKTDKIRRQLYWPQKMKIENIDALEIDWYVTHGEDCMDCPVELETCLIHKYNPRWNRQHKVAM